MDPVANVEESRQTAEGLLLLLDNPKTPPAVTENETRRLCELVLAQDDWRRSGGFDPYQQLT